MSTDPVFSLEAVAPDSADLLLGFWPLAQLTILRGDATKDLVAAK